MSHTNANLLSFPLAKPLISQLFKPPEQDYPNSSDNTVKPMNSSQTTYIQTEVSISFVNQAQTLVDASWFRNLDEVVLNALCRFLASYQEALIEDFNSSKF